MTAIGRHAQKHEAIRKHLRDELIRNERECVAMPAARPTSSPMYRCAACGSTDLQVAAWVMLTGHEVVEGGAPTDQIWCPVCESDQAGVSEIGCMEPGRREENGDPANQE